MGPHKTHLVPPRMLRSSWSFVVAFILSGYCFEGAALSACTARFCLNTPCVPTQVQVRGNWTTGSSLTHSASGDRIVTAAFSDGYFRSSPPLQIFTSACALACLSHKKIAFAGDSYNAETYIGLADILQNNPSNEEILSGAQRRRVLAEAIRNMSRIHGHGHGRGATWM